MSYNLTQRLSGDIRKTLKEIGFSVNGKMQITVMTHRKNCPECKKESTPHNIKFSPCGHEACTNCTDNLADEYEYIDGDSVETIFNCPSCSKNVVNISYI
jgi:endogenous inhibitor of DNA gyrase (YacG/DUF329 family)